MANHRSDLKRMWLRTALKKRPPMQFGQSAAQMFGMSNIPYILRRYYLM
jgi:hypothetical protein